MGQLLEFKRPLPTSITMQEPDACEFLGNTYWAIHNGYLCLVQAPGDENGIMSLAIGDEGKIEPVKFDVLAGFTLNKLDDALEQARTTTEPVPLYKDEQVDISVQNQAGTMALCFESSILKYSGEIDSLQRYIEQHR